MVWYGMVWYGMVLKIPKYYILLEKIFVYKVIVTAYSLLHPGQESAEKVREAQEKGWNWLSFAFASICLKFICLIPKKGKSYEFEDWDSWRQDNGILCRRQNNLQHQNIHNILKTHHELHHPHLHWNDVLHNIPSLILF